MVSSKVHCTSACFVGGWHPREAWDYMGFIPPCQGNLDDMMDPEGAGNAGEICFVSAVPQRLSRLSQGGSGASNDGSLVSPIESYR